MAITRSDVEDLSSDSWRQLDDSKKDAMLSIAEDMADDLFGGRVATLNEVEGSMDDFKKFLCAHLWELSEGSVAQSESSQGGNVNYNTVTGNAMSSLSETRYGRVCLEFLRQNQSISFVVS